MPRAHRFLALVCLVAAFVPTAHADVPIVLGQGNCQSPSVDVGSDGLARVVWTSDWTGSRRVYWGTFDRGGTAVQGPVEVSGGGATPYRPRIALDALDRSFVVWVAGAGTINGLRFARIGTDGTIEVAETNVDIGNDGFQGFDIDTTTGGYTHLITEHHESLHYPINYSLLSREGAPLGESPLELADDNWFFDVDSYPSLTIAPDDRVTLTWFDRDSFNPARIHLFRARYTPLGVPEVNSIIVADVGPGPTTIAKPTGDTTWLLFEDDGSGTSRILKYEGSNTTSFASPPPGPTRRPRVVSKPGVPVVAVWVDYATGTPRIVRSEWELNGTPLVTESVVSESIGSTTEPDLGMNAEGLAYAVWEDTRSGASDLYIASFQGGDSSPFPYNPGPSLSFRVDSDTADLVTTVRMSGNPPTSARTATDRAPFATESPVSVPVENGFALFDSQDLAGLADGGEFLRIDLLNATGDLVGHIGLAYGQVDYGRDTSLDAYLYVHDALREVDPDLIDGWGYYQAGEFQVSMLVPPVARFENIGDQTDRPVLFVHGIEAYFGDWHDWFTTPDAIDQSRFDGWRFFYPHDQPIADSARLLGRELERLRGYSSRRLFGCSPYAQPIDVVAHSMGGLVTRAYLQSEDNGGDVRSLLMFGTPNHGSFVSQRLRENAEGDWTHFDDLVDAFGLSDPFAPAHEDMCPASPFLMELNARPPVALGTGSIESDYMVIAGFDGKICVNRELNVALPHREIHEQSDGVVAVSSASLRTFGIPLGLVEQDHICMQVSNHPERQIEKFLDATDPLDWDAQYLDCRLLQGEDTSCAEDAGIDVGAGTLQLHIPQTYAHLDGGLDPAMHYEIESPRDGLLYLDHNRRLGVASPNLDRAWSGREDFFSRIWRWFAPHEEIGYWNDAGDYQVRIRREFPVVLLSTEWRTVAAATHPLAFRPLQTTVDSLEISTTSRLAMAAPHVGSPLVAKRNANGQTFAVDADMEWVVFNLDTVDPVLDFSGHGFALEDPTGRWIDPSAAVGDPTIEFAAFAEYGPAQYTVAQPVAGTWTVHTAGALAGERVTMLYDATFRALPAFANASASEGDSLEFALTVEGAESCASLDVDAEVYFTPLEPEGPVPPAAIALVEISPGVFTAVIRDARQGSYHVTSTANCDDGAGTVLERTAGVTAGVGRAPDDATAVVDPAPAPVRTRLDATPNPFNATTVFTIEARESGPARLDVYNLAGERVATLLDTTLPRGTRQVTWHGRDDAGRAIASGVYLARLSIGDEIRSTKITLLK